MSATLVIVAHPDLNLSRTNRAVVQYLTENTDYTVHNLYETYPDFKIDIAAEQQLLLQHENIILQFPLYWYSSPALLKEWIDRVFARGFAYSGGAALSGKTLMVSCSVGSPEALYSAEGRNKYPLAELFRPFELTALLCGMQYQPHYAIHSPHRLSEAELAEKAAGLGQVLAQVFAAN